MKFFKNLSLKLNGNQSYVRINGKTYYGNDLNEEMEEIDFSQTQSFYATEIAKIMVDAQSADVEFYASSDTDKIVVSSVGVIKASKKSKLDIKRRGNTLKVSFDGNDGTIVSINNSISIVNSNIGFGNTNSSSSDNLLIKIYLPKKLFDEIDVSTLSGDIYFEKGIKTKYLNVSKTSGDICGNIISKSIDIKSISGDVDFDVNPLDDLVIGCSSISGDVYLKLENVCLKKKSVSTISGSQSIRNNSDGKYDAFLNISTISGDIEVE